MPQEWVDDEFKGAEALAYRLDLDVYGTKCGYFSNVENVALLLLVWWICILMIRLICLGIQFSL
ncbi:hypothetical protein BSPWISOXPB_3611 [uncultured Gammaproteobacteria bacterium]|nr:hypothetical protein BSPWISOXPB_3611 [uncultured Gammaproteobacteria bacterium]